ncbi:hypothetical protein EWD52_23500 [Salmonella enterica subsp. enterica serovar Braenderup]|nr:hypothetical protein [Salmonella enterica subsp. enterica serovar Braenderup]ECD1500265.1 hypothetical protein [Salmonella enterica subsp. enterica serovar Braenderup]
MIPSFTDAFVSKGRVAFSFRDRGFRQNQEGNDLLISNINKILLRDNDGKTVISHAIRDSLIGGDVFTKVFVDGKTYHNTDEISDWVELSAYARQLVNGWVIDTPAEFAESKKGSYKGFEWKTQKITTPNEMTGQDAESEIRLIRGSIPLVMVDDKIKVENVHLKDFYVDDSNGHDWAKCRYVCHSVETTVGEAELKGYDPEKLKRGADTLKDEELPTMFFSQKYSDLSGDKDFDSTDPKEMKIKIDEHYIYSSQIHPKGETRCYQVITVGGEWLETNEILEFPFVHGQSETVLGEFWGRSIYDKAKPIQDLKTQQLRLIIHNAEQTVHPRYKAIKGMYNRESLLQASRPGAVIEMGQAGAVEQFEKNQLAPEFYQAWQMVNELENQLLFRGFSSQDLKDISPLSMVTVAMGIAEDAKKSGVIMECIGKTLVNQLINKIFRTMRAENWPIEDETGAIVKDFTYPEIYDIELEMNTSGDDAAQVMQMQAISGWESQMSQFNSPVHTAQNRYEMAKFMYTRADIDPSKFITDPSTQQDPHAAQEAATATFIEAERHKGQLVGIELDNQLKAAQVAKAIQDLEQTEKDKAIDREIRQQNAITAARKVELEAQGRVSETMNQASKVAVDKERNNLDFTLGVAKAHSEHVNRVNGVM